MVTKLIPCPSCGGSGMTHAIVNGDIEGVKDCRDCQGSGEVDENEYNKNEGLWDEARYEDALNADIHTDEDEGTTLFGEFEEEQF